MLNDLALFLCFSFFEVIHPQVKKDPDKQIFFFANVMCRVAYLKIKMKSMSSMQKVATLSMVFINTTSCLCRAGMKRTSFSTRISRKVRSTDRPPPCWPTISQTLFTKKTKQNRFIFIFANYLLLTLDIKHSAYAVLFDMYVPLVLQSHGKYICNTLHASITESHKRKKQHRSVCGHIYTT